MIYNQFFHYCESLGTTLLRKSYENNHESWNNASSDNESQINQSKTEKCPTNILRNFQKNESRNFIRLKQTVKQNILPEDRNKITAEMIKKADKDFCMNLPSLVEMTAQDTKMLDAIISLESGRPDDIFYSYRPNRDHLETRFGLLFHNDKIVIPEDLRSTIFAMLHQGNVSINKIDQSAETFWWLGLHREIWDKAENCPSGRAAGKNLKTQLPQTEINRLEVSTEPGQDIQLDFAGPINSKSGGDFSILFAIDRFSK